MLKQVACLWISSFDWFMQVTEVITLGKLFVAQQLTIKNQEWKHDWMPFRIVLLSPSKQHLSDTTEKPGIAVKFGGHFYPKQLTIAFSVYISSVNAFKQKLLSWECRRTESTFKIAISPMYAKSQNVFSFLTYIYMYFWSK